MPSGVKRGGTKKIYQCKVKSCGKVLDSQAHLKKHEDYLAKHGKCPPKRVSYQGLDLEFKCPEAGCDKSYPTAAKLRQHILSHKEYKCPYPSCGGKNLKSQYNLDQHVLSHKNNPKFKALNTERPKVLDKDGKKRFKCSSCTETFATSGSLEDHIIANHKKVKLLDELSQREMRLMNPFGRYFPLRGMEKPVWTDPDLEKTVDWIYEWLKVRTETMKFPQHGVYLGAVLGRKFKSGMDIYKFIRQNPDQTWFYWGSDSKGSTDIHQHHKQHPQTSPLGRAALQGLTVVCLYRFEDFEGDWEERAGEMKMKESELIQTCSTDREFTPVPGIQQFKYLNQRLEQGAMLNIGEEERSKKMHNLFKRVIRNGVQLLCFEEDCTKNCHALVHPFKVPIIVDMSKAMKKSTNDDDDDVDMEDEKEHKDPWDVGYSEPERVLKKRPADVDEEVAKRLQQFKDKINANLQRYPLKHHGYTVITVDRNNFPGKSPRKIAQSVLNKKDEEFTIGHYVGVNDKAKQHAHHTSAPEYSSIAKELKDPNKISIEINTKDFASRRLARMNEALEIVQAQIQCWFQKDGIKFNPLNKHAELLYLSLNTPEDIRQSIRLGLLGVSPVSLDGPPTQTLNNGQYPVELKPSSLPTTGKKN